MTREQLEKIWEETQSDWKGDNAIQGLQILQKYFDPTTDTLICGADHDVFWSVDIGEALERGLTEEDATTLARLNWSIDEDGECFSCFV